MTPQPDTAVKTATMLSYHGDPAVKQKYLERVEMHLAADHLQQGIGWSRDDDENAPIKGCAVGCTLETYSHSRYPIELGLPEWLAHLEDHIFEALSVEDSKEWPGQFLSSIPVGVSEEVFSGVRDRFQIFWLERQKTQIDQAKYPDVSAAIDGVIKLLNEALAGAEPNSAAWSAARSAANSAAWSAANSAARSAAESAAWSAANSAARSAARSAAESAANSAARSAARSAAESAARSAAESAAWSAAESAARSVRNEEARVKRDWLIAELKSLKP